MEDLTGVQLDTIANGYAPKLFDYLFKEVLANIEDPNYPAKKKRKITLEIEIEPLDSRKEARVTVSSKLKLADVESRGGHIFISGQRAATHDTRQGDLDEELEAAGADANAEG